MNDSLDDWLDSISLQSDDTPATTLESSTSSVFPTDASSEESQPQPLSSEDFDEILASNGFTQPMFDEAEEIRETYRDTISEEDYSDPVDPTADDEDEELHRLEQAAINAHQAVVEYDENGGEGRDLDAEEDADWDERIGSGEIREFDSASVVGQEVHFHMPNGETVDVPIVHEGHLRIGRGIMAQIEDISTGTSANTLSLSDIENALIDVDIHNIGMEETAIQQEPSHTPDETTAMVESSRANVARRRAHQQEVANQEEFLIPLNSPTLLLDESTTRFSGAEWFNKIQEQSIILAGIGGIGSNVAFQLARMNPAALFMYDDDAVEVVNMAGQLYARSDVGKSKVAAMSDMITSYTNMQNIYAIRERFTSTTEAGNIMMCGFDNMEARKSFFDSWIRHVEILPEEEKKKCLFLDGRLSIDCLQVFCITGDDVYNTIRYSKDYLFSDEEAEYTVCSMKQTTYLACMIGSIMVNLFTNFCANLLDPIIPYDLPFFTEYDAQNMIFKTST